MNFSSKCPEKSLVARVHLSFISQGLSGAVVEKTNKRRFPSKLTARMGLKLSGESQALGQFSPCLAIVTTSI